MVGPPDACSLITATGGGEMRGFPSGELEKERWKAIIEHIFLLFSMLWVHVKRGDPSWSSSREFDAKWLTDY
jgi:hypothetical protein